MDKYSIVTTLSGIGLGLFVVSACSDDKRSNFLVEGIVHNASGETIYLEEVGTGNVLSLDSTTLDDTGHFSFYHRGTTYPMYYSLRLGASSIPFAADSLTKLSLETTKANFFTGYKLTQADPFNHQIKEIATLRYRTDKGIDSIQQLYRSGSITPQDQENSIDSLVSSFKSYLSAHYIYIDPKSPAAYFALYQRKGDIPYFSIYQEGDDRAFAAVATAYELYYPEAPYLDFLKDEALKAIAIRRMRRSSATPTMPASADTAPLTQDDQTRKI